MGNGFGRIEIIVPLYVCSRKIYQGRPLGFIDGNVHPNFAALINFVNKFTVRQGGNSAADIGLAVVLTIGHIISNGVSSVDITQL